MNVSAAFEARSLIQQVQCRLAQWPDDLRTGLGAARRQGPDAIGVASSAFMDDNEGNLEPAATVLRFHFSNPLVPQCIYDFDVTTGALTLRKQDSASRWCDRHRYVLDQFSATAPDGERVPITIVYRKGMRHPGGNPTLIVGYGAYGLSLRATSTINGS